MRSRLRSIDLVRGIAVALMIASHTCDALLAPVWREGAIWHLSSIIFGFVGPAFLLLAGVTLGLQLDAISDDCAAKRWRIARRLAVVLLLGYWLQIPVLSLSQLVLESRPEDMRRMFDTNILHAIVLASGAILLLTSLLRSCVAVRVAVAGLAAVLLVATPYVWDAELYRDLWLPIRSFIAPQPVATFPLLPYAFYLLVGFLLTPLFADAERAKQRGSIMAAAGVVLVIAGPLLQMLLAGIPHHEDFWGAGIGHTLMRAGGVIAALGIALGFGRSVVAARAPMLEEIGRRSLAIYTLHLVLLYGSPMTMGLRYWFDGAFDRIFPPVPVVIIGASITMLCYHAMLLWEGMREEQPRVAFWLCAIWWGRFVVLFVGG